MYRTCLFCNGDLGSNEALETFPVGARIAFDAAKGRLWVVCRRCERWNLSPLEERWEAIEAAERFYRDTRIRVSTENIGLARHPSGLVLVRVGRPLRPEFAAWRYGDQFGRRRRKAYLLGGGVVLAMGAAIGLGYAAGVLSGIMGLQVIQGYHHYADRRTRLVLRPSYSEVVKLRRDDLWSAEIIPDASSGEWSFAFTAKKERRAYHGEDARRIASVVLPALNATGGKPQTVQGAVQALEECGGSQSFLADIERFRPTTRRSISDRYILLANMSKPTRLAFEMALHEEQERRALEGELKELELAWQAAEEIAGISDDLLLPDSVRRRLTS